MTVHNYRSRQVHETLNGVNPSSGFRDMRSAKSGSNLWQIWQVFGPWASPYGANGQMSMTVHNYRPRQFHRTSNGENPSSGYRDMGSTSLAAARPTARPPARTVTTIPLQPGGLRGKKDSHETILSLYILCSWNILVTKMTYLYWNLPLYDKLKQFLKETCASDFSPFSVIRKLFLGYHNTPTFVLFRIEQLVWADFWQHYLNLQNINKKFLWFMRVTSSHTNWIITDYAKI